MDMPSFIDLVFDEIIDYMWKNQDELKYEKIANLSTLVEFSDLKKSKALFKIAYSYVQMDEKSVHAERLYIVLLNQEPHNASALNNLGRILEKRNDLEKALEYYKKAYEIDKTDDIVKSNYSIVSEQLTGYQNVLIALKKENAWLMKRLTLLCEESNSLNEFTCTNKNRSVMLNVSPAKADELFNDFCEKKYILKIANDGASKYQINALVKRHLKLQEKLLKENERYEKIGSKLSVDELRKIGYTEDVVFLINKIADEELRGILLRDIHECAISVVVEQYKSAILLCGSMIEAVLVYVTLQNRIEKYDIGSLLQGKSKIKPVKDMDLNELLELGKQEKIIKAEEYHLSNYIRAYRNIIHPSCEVRKSYNVDELTTNLMWKALLAIIREIL